MDKFLDREYENLTAARNEQRSSSTSTTERPVLNVTESLEPILDDPENVTITEVLEAEQNSVETVQNSVPIVTNQSSCLDKFTYQLEIDNQFLTEFSNVTVIQRNSNFITTFFLFTSKYLQFENYKNEKKMVRKLIQKLNVIIENVSAVETANRNKDDVHFVKMANIEINVNWIMEKIMLVFSKVTLMKHNFFQIQMFDIFLS